MSTFTPRSLSLYVAFLYAGSRVPVREAAVGIAKRVFVGGRATWGTTTWKQTSATGLVSFSIPERDLYRLTSTVRGRQQTVEVPVLDPNSWIHLLVQTNGTLRAEAA